jgi:LCP family protein required for cell wall assembly
MKNIPLPVLLIFTLAGLALACNLPLLSAPPEPVAQAITHQTRGPLVAVPADATPTATPFQPLAPTPTYIPTAMPIPPTPTPEPTEIAVSPAEARSWGDYPGPVVWADINIPPPVGLLPKPEDQVNILLLGSDQRPYDGGFRTDTIMLLTLNPHQGVASVTSFPRDLYVYIPGWTVQRINTALGHGGFETLALTFEYNFGVRPDHYLMVNFSAFRQVIDSLGGIDVNVGATLTDHRDGRGNYTVRAGVNTMDGETALWYVRSRYTTNDFDRTRRQQEVLQALFTRLLSLDAVGRAPELFDIYRQNVTTDLELADLTPLLPLAAQLSASGEIEQHLIGLGQVTPWTSYSGASVLLPNREAILEIMKDALNSP